MEVFHTPILLHQILDLAEHGGDPRRNRLLWDGTVGEGGHSLALLQRFVQARLIASDQDPQILARAQKRLAEFAPRVQLLQGNFAQIPEQIAQHSLDFALFDLGISSFHLEQMGRGFSLRDESSLDMRLDPALSQNGAEVLNQYSQNALADVFYYYGEERFARPLARLVVEGRPWSNGAQLAEAIRRWLERKKRKTVQGKKKKGHAKGDSHIHPATRVFQAVRIEVNGELDKIQSLLRQLPWLMAPGGVVGFLSFHSLEDRLIKWAFRLWQNPRSLPPEKQDFWGSFYEGDYSLGRILTSKPVMAGEEEKKSNPRSQSAKLRAFRFGVDNKKGASIQ